MAILTAHVADCKLSNDPVDVLVTHALGSCIAILLYEPIAKVAGLLHFMLPDSSVDTAKAVQYPFMFADTGIPLLLHRASLLGADKTRTMYMVAGGARMLKSTETFNIGQRNLMAATEILQQYGIRPKKHDIGGTSARTLRIDVAGGRVRVSSTAHGEQESITDLAKLGLQCRPGKTASM